MTNPPARALGALSAAAREPALGLLAPIPRPAVPAEAKLDRHPVKRIVERPSLEAGLELGDPGLVQSPFAANHVELLVGSTALSVPQIQAGAIRAVYAEAP